MQGTVLSGNQKYDSMDCYALILACSLLGNGVAAIFGPSDKPLAEHVQSICDSVDMPNVVARWDVNPTRLKAFNLYPHVEELSNVSHDRMH